jgi:hypothetical protein
MVVHVQTLPTTTLLLLLPPLLLFPYLYVSTYGVRATAAAAAAAAVASSPVCEHHSWSIYKRFQISTLLLLPHLCVSNSGVSESL